MKIWLFVGLIGHRKSTFINALCGEKMCEVSSNINPGALEYQLISFFHKNHLFNVIDTPGLDNSDSNNKNIEQINNLLINCPKIKILILIKRYI